MCAESSGELNHHVFLSAVSLTLLLTACLEVGEQQMVPQRRNESGRQGRMRCGLSQREREREIQRLNTFKPFLKQRLSS